MTSTTITATALSSGNAVIPGEVVSFSTSTGQLIVSSTTTDDNGQATATFSAGASGINRTATITASSGALSSQLPVLIVGSTVSANPVSGTSVPDDGVTTATVTFTALNGGGSPVSGAAFTLTKTGLGNISYAPTSGTTDQNGRFTVTVTGVPGGAGAATLIASALGATGSANITVSTVSTTFAITGLALNGTALTSADTNSFSATAMQISDSLVVTVTAPVPTANVTFVTTMGIWNGVANQTSVVVPVAGGTASASLTTSSAGQANVQVIDQANSSVSDTLAVSMTAKTAAAITLQASPSVVPKSTGSTTGTSTLIATVTDATGQPVGGAPVSFSIINPTGGGESVSPAVAYTASTLGAGLGLGQARTTFTAGSQSSGQAGVQVRGQVLGAGGACPGATCVATEANIPTPLNQSPSGNDAAIVIGGSAGSVAFGQATALGVNSNATAYVLAMSVMVADSNGNPAPQGTVVNLSLWPIAVSTGGGCAWDPDGKVWDSATAAYVPGNGGTFVNEDINENLILDAAEDGTRTRYYAGTWVPAAGTTDTYITPANSVAGTIPGTVTTDASGVATFDLTYPKTSALWTVVRIRGGTVVQSSDSVGEMQFRLGALQSDVSPCRLNDSPFIY
jgi:peroxiredoxin